MRPRELRELSAVEVRRKVGDFEEELFNLRFQQKMGQSSNPVRMRLIRRDIARAKTSLKEKARTGRQ